MPICTEPTSVPTGLDRPATPQPTGGDRARRGDTAIVVPAPSAHFFSLFLTLRQKLTPRASAALVIGTVTLVAVLPHAASLAEDRKAKQPAERRQEAMPIRVETAEARGFYRVEKAYTGALVAARRSRLAFERPGKLAEVLVDEGAEVQPGQVLARLDRRRLLARRAAVAAELAEARAVLDELEFGPRVETIATAEAEVRSLAAQRDAAVRNLRRRERLVATEAISREEYEESFYATRVAEARVAAAQKQLDELRAGTRVERVAAQRARVDALAAQLRDVDHELEDSELVAPYAGSIARRYQDEGGIVSAGEVALDLIESDRLEAWIGVPAAAARRLEIGREVGVLVNGREHGAVVRSVRSELDPSTRTQNVVLELKQRADGGLVAGQVARVMLPETIRQPGFEVPASALTPGRRGLWAVYVVAGETGAEKVARRDVELIHTEGGRSYVRGTLQPGERVVVAGGHKIVAGQRVQVVSDS